MLDTKIFARKVRQSILHMVNQGKSSHVASALSTVDILSVLYAKILNIDPLNPLLKQRDYFFLSKGHAGAAVYATLAERGFFDKNRLAEHCQNGAYLSGHVSHKNVPGVELSTGSLGHALSVGAGLAYACQLEKSMQRVFVLLSDGECDEGSNWEAILFAGHHRLTPLTVIIDYNKIQSITYVKDTLDLEPFAAKWKAFRWDVLEVDGHNHQALTHALSTRENPQKPLCVIAHTTKGKGISFMENNNVWHYRSPQGEDYIKALQDLEEEF